MNYTIDKLVSGWKDITLEKGIEIYRLNLKMPTKLRAIYDAVIKDENQAKANEIDKSISSEDKFELFDFYGEAISLLYELPEQTMQNISNHERLSFYKAFCEKYIIGIFYGIPNDEIVGIDNFTFNNETYYLPKYKRLIEQDVPCWGETTLTAIDLLDLEVSAQEFEAGKFEVATKIIAILCRKKDEVYARDLLTIRANEFLQLKMDVVFEVFFCLHDLSIISQQTTLISSLKKAVVEMEAIHHGMILL